MKRISEFDTVRDIVRGITGVVIDGELDETSKFKRVWISGFGRAGFFNFTKPIVHTFSPEDGIIMRDQLETLLKSNSRFSVLFENASVHFVLTPYIHGAMSAALSGQKKFVSIHEIFGVSYMNLIKSSQDLSLSAINSAESDIGVRVSSTAYILSHAILDPSIFCPLIERINGI